MSLLTQFEESQKEVYQVTRNEWINIKIDHMTEWYNKAKITEGLKSRLETEKIEASCFHREQVENALKKNVKVSAEVLKDYPELLKKI